MDARREFQLFPPIEPCGAGMLPADALHTLHWKERRKPMARVGEMEESRREGNCNEAGRSQTGFEFRQDTPAAQRKL